MLQGILGLISTLFGWLGNLLPESPFANLVQISDNLQLGIYWLNWVVPIDSMLLLLGAWLAACAVVTAVRLSLNVTGGIGKKVAGG